MESIGQKLKEARESKHLLLDQVARETNIAKRYLQALEEENFPLFPGDTYIIGFLRNYAEYLGLNSAEVITLYKNLRLQEQPVPIETLLAKKKNPFPLIAGIAAVLILAGGVTWFVLRPETPQKEKESDLSRSAMKIEYKSAVLEQPFIEGDEIVFPEQIGTLKVQKVSSTVELVGAFGKLSMKQGQESLLDFPQSEQAVKVYCSTIAREEKPPRAMLKFEVIPKLLAASAQGAALSQQTGIESSGAGIPVGSTNEPTRIARSKVILEAPAKTPFTLDIEFTGYCFFRYRVDDAEQEEKYFRKGENFRVDVQREIYLGFSNAGSLNARIRGTQVEFGRPGQVGVGIIKWVDDPTGGPARLEFVPYY
jgi:cytoskeletal protein RodZ